MAQTQQNKDVQISTTKGKSENNIKKIFSKIYDYVLKRLKTEKIVKNSLIVEKAKFIKYIDEENDMSVGVIKLYSDLSSTETNAFILNPSFTFVTQQTVLVGYWDSLNNLYILGPADKKGV